MTIKTLDELRAALPLKRVDALRNGGADAVEVDRLAGELWDGVGAHTGDQATTIRMMVKMVVILADELKRTRKQHNDDLRDMERDTRDAFQAGRQEAEERHYNEDR